VTTTDPAKAAEARAKARERLRKWRAENPERAREQTRRYREKHPEVGKRNRKLYIERHPEKEQERKRRLQQRRIAAGKLVVADRARKHGVNWQEAFLQLWEAQGGRCYLCGDHLNRDEPHATVFDHHHACCPSRHTCDICRRGLACGRCNKLVGLADEDPERLRRIADALAAANELVLQRLAARPLQETMF
jgi:hypothetical protein